jgi:hypothetical protein
MAWRCGFFYVVASRLFLLGNNAFRLIWFILGITYPMFRANYTKKAKKLLSSTGIHDSLGKNAQLQYIGI